MTHKFGHSNKWNSKTMKIKKRRQPEFTLYQFLKTSPFSGVSTGKNSFIWKSEVLKPNFSFYPCEMEVLPSSWSSALIFVRASGLQ